MTPDQAYNNPAKKKNIRRLASFFAQAVAAGGDMTEEMAEELLDGLSTDGKQIFSGKIMSFGSGLLALSNRYGIDIPPHLLASLLSK